MPRWSESLLMKTAVLVFPGSNCDRDCKVAVERSLAAKGKRGKVATWCWHQETAELPSSGLDLIVLPGGFAYGDYLRCGFAMASLSPVMRAVSAAAAIAAFAVAGICNWRFQVLCEARHAARGCPATQCRPEICLQADRPGRGREWPDPLFTAGYRQTGAGSTVDRDHRQWRGQLFRFDDATLDRAGRRGSGGVPLQVENPNGSANARSPASSIKPAMSWA